MAIYNENFLVLGITERVQKQKLKDISPAGQQEITVDDSGDKLKAFVDRTLFGAGDTAYVVITTGETRTVAKVVEINAAKPSITLQGLPKYPYSTIHNLYGSDVGDQGPKASLSFTLTEEQTSILRGVVDQDLLPDKKPRYIGSEVEPFRKIYADLMRVNTINRSDGDEIRVPETNGAGATFLTDRDTSEVDPGCFKGNICATIPEATSITSRLLGGEQGDLVTFTKWKAGSKSEAVSPEDSHIQRMFGLGQADYDLAYRKKEGFDPAIDSKSFLTTINDRPHQISNIIVEEKSGEDRYARVTFLPPIGLDFGTFAEHLKTVLGSIGIGDHLGHAAFQGNLYAANADFKGNLHVGGYRTAQTIIGTSSERTREEVLDDLPLYTKWEESDTGKLYKVVGTDEDKSWRRIGAPTLHLVSNTMSTRTWAELNVPEGFEYTDYEAFFVHAKSGRRSGGENSYWGSHFTTSGSCGPGGSIVMPFVVNGQQGSLTFNVSEENVAVSRSLYLAWGVERFQVTCMGYVA